MAVIKANAYGHGLVRVAKALPNADAFGVARLDEALALRDAGIGNRIVLLEGVSSSADLTAAVQFQLDCVVHESSQLRMLRDLPSATRLRVWLKFDTGMNRLGFRCEEATDVHRYLQALRAQSLEVHLMTHFACADERENSATRDQYARLQSVQQKLASFNGARRMPVSVSNSAGILGWPDLRSDWVRAGLALYGISPFADCKAANFGLTPVMSLKTAVIAIRDVPVSESVGYGAAWRAETRSAIAILAGGYGDGIPRRLPTGTPVIINGRRVPIVGRVSMDMLAVDVTGVPDVGVGTAAEFWGPSLPVEEIAAIAGTIPYEILCGVSQRVPFERVRSQTQ